jgi:hypothetical protein
MVYNMKESVIDGACTMLPRTTGGCVNPKKRKIGITVADPKDDFIQTASIFERAAKMAEFFLLHPFTRLNNVPTSTQLCSSSARKYTLGGKAHRHREHNRAMAQCGAHVAVKNKKSNTQMHVGPNLSSATMTRQYVCTLNGGCSSMEQVLNANDLAVAVSRVGDDFSMPCALETLDMSMSGTFPYTVDIVRLRNHDSKHWTLTIRQFSGAMGTPWEWALVGMNAKVTIYRSGKFIMSGGLTLSQFGDLLRSTIKMLRGGPGAGPEGGYGPCFFMGINLANLQELCGIQKSALIFSAAPGPDGSHQRFKLFGPDRVAIFTPKPELPDTAMPSGSVPSRKTLKQSCKPGGTSFEAARAMHDIYPDIARVHLLGCSPAVAPKLSMMPPGGAKDLAEIMSTFFPSPPSQSKCKPKAQHKNREREEACRDNSLSMGAWRRVAPWADSATWEEDAAASGMAFPGRLTATHLPQQEDFIGPCVEEPGDTSWNPSNCLRQIRSV